MAPAWLFCPADRPDRYAKAVAVADTVILDLEDAVVLEAKEVARAAVISSHLDPERTIIRINPANSPEHSLDLAAVARTAYRKIMLPKAEAPADLALLADYEVVALCETPQGILGAAALAAQEQVIALTWGAEDLIAALGGTSSRCENGRFRDLALHARSSILLAAAAAGKPAIETVFLDLTDADGAQRMAAEARASGFSAMMCIHPRQVEIVREAFAPSIREITWARHVLDAADARGHGVFTFAGRMVDEPVLRQARRILGREGK